jgi:putative phosphoribosyl transferase
VFKNRKEAGQLLAGRLADFMGKEDVIVVGIPRGGVPVASELARSLNLPLDVVVTRKLGAPGQRELAIGAIGPEGVSVFDKNLIQRLQVSEEYKKMIIEREKKEMKERMEKFRGKKVIDFKGKTAIVVDDGIATGATVEAAVKYLRKKGVKKVVLAVPVAPLESVSELEKLSDEFVAVDTPKDFYAVGQFYRDFPQTTDEEVIKLLQNA